jgi:D-lactate dehydrogenase
MDNKIKIAFFDTKSYDKQYFGKFAGENKYKITYFDTQLNADTANLATGFDVVCAFVNADINKVAIDILYNLGVKLIALRCAGYNNVDLKAAFGKIHVVRVPAYSPYAIAEHAVALLLSLVRHIPQAYNRTRDGNFLLQGLVGFDLHGKTAGIIGTGKIGKIIAGILKGFGMEILAYDIFPDNEWAKLNGVRYLPLEELCALSDVLSLNIILSTETYHIIDTKMLSLMKSNALIINTSRGALIDTSALIQSLKEKRIGGACLDVYEEEEKYFFEDWSNNLIQDDVLSRLMTFPNVIITGHQAFFTHEALSAIAETTIFNIEQFFGNGKLDNEICYKCGTLECRKKIGGKCF